MYQFHASKSKLNHLSWQKKQISIHCCVIGCLEQFGKLPSLLLLPWFTPSFRALENFIFSIFFFFSSYALFSFHRKKSNCDSSTLGKFSWKFHCQVQTKLGIMENVPQKKEFVRQMECVAVKKSGFYLQTRDISSRSSWASQKRDSFFPLSSRGTQKRRQNPRQRS